MDLRLLRTFDQVASFMSFHRAAKALHCTQSTVSAQIRSLEEELGAPVFERLGRRIALTPAGEELRRHARRLLDDERDLRAAVREVGETVGRIRLRAPQSVALAHLPAILQRFCAAYPRVGVDVSNCGYSHLVEELRAGELDAGFLLGMALEAAELCSEVVSREAMAWVASPASELAARAGLTIRDLGGRTLLLPKHDCGYRMKLEQELVEARVQPAAVLDLNSVAAIARCLEAGIGVALLPERAVAEELAAGRLARLRWREPQEEDLFFFRHRDKPLVGAYGAFVAVVEGYFAELRSGRRRGGERSPPAAPAGAATRPPPAPASPPSRPPSPRACRGR